jgi:hypothetical protein
VEAAEAQVLLVETHHLTLVVMAALEHSFLNLLHGELVIQTHIPHPLELLCKTAEVGLLAEVVAQ